MNESLNLLHERGLRGELLCAKMMANLPNPRIQESEFRTTFLPMFVGGGEFINVNAWRAVAGSLTNEVDVCVGNEVLFTVPPMLLEVRSVISTREPGGSMASTLNGALLDAVEDTTGREAFELVADQANHAEHMVIDKRDEYMARWDAIFKRYGIDYLEVRKEVAKIKYNIDVKDDITAQSSKRGGAWGPELDEEFKFDDDGAFSY